MTSLNSILRWVVLATIGLVLLVTGYMLWLQLGGNLFGNNNLPEEHLIPNVPYRGQYLGTELTNQQPVAVRTILDYWGKTDVTNQTLFDIFETKNVFQDSERFNSLGTDLSAQFLSSLGFMVERYATSSPEYIKYLIANNVPTYVKQNLGSAYLEGAESTRIYIGYSDKGEYFIVHDNNFGNNYIISYDEYNKINQDQTVLMARPLGYEMQDSPQRETADPSSYPARLPIMDDLGLRDVQVKIIEFNASKISTVHSGSNDDSALISILEDMLKHEAFTRLHPAAQMTMSYNLVDIYMNRTTNYPRAIEILENVTLPLIENHDFSQAYGGWDRKMDPSVYDRPFYHAIPWTTLGYAYLKTNQAAKAEMPFKKALEYVPGFEPAVEGLKHI